ncbi:MAG TPA: MFS transporter, partial [Chloroflexota bacterium]
LAMMIGSSIAAGLVQRIGGKMLLIPGLALFAAGMGYIDWMAHVDSGRWSFLPGLIVSGFGMGFVWTPVYSIATQDLRPQLAGVAAGVLSTVQELGGVIASAAVGALLQDQLATALHARAVQAAAHLPPAIRGHFVAGFSNAAKSGFQVGRGETGGNLNLPASVGAALRQHIAQLAHSVFTNAFVDAMHPTLALPISVVVLAALGCFAVRPSRPQPAEVRAQPEEAVVA